MSNDRIEHGATERIITTGDLPLAAFYRMRGLEIVRVTRRGGGGNMDFDFHFSDPSGLADGLRIQWVNSEFQVYDNAVRALKKLCAESRRSTGRNGTNRAASPRRP